MTPRPNALAEALASLHHLLAHNSRDWGLDRADAWLYAVLVGWDCEMTHEHNDVCENGEAIQEIAAQHNWAPGDIERVRRYRAAIRVAADGGHPST
jgi:hypothetical protein